MIKHSLLNEFIHDHRCYFTKDSFHCLLSTSGFEVISMDIIWDGYVLSAVAKKRVADFWADMSKSRIKMRAQIIKFFRQTERFENAIWSAGHQSLSTISNLELANQVSCIIDPSEAKQNSRQVLVCQLFIQIFCMMVRLNVFWLWLRVTMRKLLVF